jgi:hypothetical protein
MCQIDVFSEGCDMMVMQVRNLKAADECSNLICNLIKKFHVDLIFTYEFVMEAADSKCWMSELLLLQLGFLHQHAF